MDASQQDDHPFNRQVGREILETAGAFVTVVCNGKEVLEQLQQQAYDCILMDLRMPVINGLATTKLIRQSESDSHICIIAMTANTSQEDRQQCHDVGMDDFVTKPLEPDSLITTLAYRLAKKQLN